ncbi:MAG: caspase family protein [Thermoguttaceae bacterium]|nr:caspase family protein [Thermoguttaceae bacterium]
MKRFCLQYLLFILFTGFAFLVFAEGNAQRQWKSVSGRVVMTGTFEKFKPTDPSWVYFRSSNGKLYQYPFDKLSKEDREFIQSLDNEDPDLVEVEEAPEETVKNTAKSRGSRNSNSNSAREMGKRYALLVGVNHYLDLNQLECAVADIQLIQEKLFQLGFESENIRMYITGNSIGKYPDKKTVEAGFREILKEADENSQIFIAFAGHGFEIDNVSYFAVEDTRTDSNDSLKKTAINVNAMLEELHNCKASSKWFIVDACREYMIPKRSSRLPKISRGINSAGNGNLPEGVFFLQSCKTGESSYEDNGNGLFTRCFADALDGKADANNNGELTVLEVFEYVYTNVKKDALNNLSKRQTPTFSIPENTPNFTIAYTANLLQHGLPNKEWDRVQKLYDKSLKLFADNKKEEGLELLDQAMDVMKNADDDAPLKERIKIVSKQVRNSIAERKKLEENFEKEKASLRAQIELEKENAILKAQLEAEKLRIAEESKRAAEEARRAAEEARRAEEARKAAEKANVVREQPKPQYHFPTQFVYLGKVPSIRGDNSQARAFAAQYGYRLPSPSELSQISRNDISGIPSDGWIETSDPNVVCDIFFQQLNPVQKRGTGMNLVVGCR